MKSRFLLAACLLATQPLSAIACSTCMVGDPTQSLMGAEKPFENRLRVSIDYMNRSEELGVAGVNEKIVDEQRITTNIAWAPNRRWMLGLSIPYVNRDLESFNLSDQSITSLGDISLTVKSFMQEKESFQTHMYGLMGGVKFGTAKEQRDVNGVVYDFDVQTGQGADVLNLGGWYAHFRYPWMFYSSATYHIAGKGYQQFQAGDALVFNANAQWAQSQKLSWYIGAEGRYSDRDRFAGIEDADSGGTIVFLTPGLIYTLNDDLLLNAVIKLPAVESLNGDHDETTIFSIGITYDFEIH
jgi:hypothetical protein